MTKNKQDDDSQIVQKTTKPAIQTRPWVRALLTLVLFASGIIVGTCGTLMFVRHQVHYRIHHPEEMPARIASHIGRKFDLSDDQTSQAESIVRERQAAIQQIRREFQPKLEVELQQLAEQVSDILDNDQRVAWQERFDDLRSQWLPSPPE